MESMSDLSRSNLSCSCFKAFWFLSIVIFKCGMDTWSCKTRTSLDLRLSIFAFSSFVWLSNSDISTSPFSTSIVRKMTFLLSSYNKVSLSWRSLVISELTRISLLLQPKTNSAFFLTVLYSSILKALLRISTLFSGTSERICFIISCGVKMANR